jgi:dTDP-L-rhamnose 4-epimerase
VRRVLITGGAGLIGQAIAKRHALGGDKVYLYDKRLNKFNNYNNLIGEELDATQPIDKYIKKYKFQIISIQASHVGVGESQYSIQKYVSNNLCALSSVLESLSKNSYSLTKILLAGSMGPYGEGPYLCSEHGVKHPVRINIANPTCDSCGMVMYPQAITENSKINPISVYAFTKAAQEQLLEVFSNTHKIKSTSLRYFSVYSVESNPLNPYTGVLSIIANKLLNGPVLTLYEDGQQTRDLICDEDVAEAHFLESHFNNSQYFDAVNVGTGISVSLAEIAIKMRDALAPHKAIIYSKELRSGDIKHSKASIAMIKSRLNWAPQVAIMSGITDYIAFIEKNRKKFTIGIDTTEEESRRLISNRILRKL